jgi:hypothetical protein
MNEPKRVRFCLVPFVSLYKKRAKTETPVMSETPTPSFLSSYTCMSKVEEPQQNMIIENSHLGSTGGADEKPLSSTQEPLSLIGPPAPFNLSIRAPQHQDLYVKDVPNYDASPMSPATLSTLAEMRLYEEALRKEALSEALSGFHEQPTPLHHRTPESAVLTTTSSYGGGLSPLSL